MSQAGYHLKPIEKGVLGTFSKVREEYEEFLDALSQQSVIMALIELSDLLGAIYFLMETKSKATALSAYNISILNAVGVRVINQEMSPKEFLDKAFIQFEHCQSDDTFDKLLVAMNVFVSQYNMTLHDLNIMSSITQRAFRNGVRHFIEKHTMRDFYWN